MSNIHNAPLHHAGLACSSAIKAARDVENAWVQEWARSRLIDFNHWTAGVGLFANGRNALDHRLLRSPGTKNALLSVLEMLTTVFYKICQTSTEPEPFQALSPDDVPGLQDEKPSPVSSLSFSPWSSEGEEAPPGDSDADTNFSGSMLPQACHELGSDAERLIDRLVDLGLVIRRSGLSSSIFRADSSFKESLYYHLRTHLNMLLQLSNLRASSGPSNGRDHQNASSDIASLSSITLRPDQLHLILANLRRRHRFAFARKRASTLAISRGTEEPAVLSKDLPQTIQEPKITPNKSGLDQPVAESRAISTQETASAVDRDLDVKVGEIVSHSADEHPTNEDSLQAASTAASVAVNTMNYPNAPRAKSQRAFKCPCCYQVLGRVVGRDRKKWRKHVAKDLYPYTCPIVECTSNTTFFVKRKNWKAHLREHHTIVSSWICSVCGDNTMFYSQSAFENHLQDRHAKAIGRKNMSTMVDLSRREAINLPAICPICNLHRDSVRLDSFIDHLADCIHGFSLSSLPWNDVSDQSLPTLHKEAADSISAWLTQVQNSNELTNLTDSVIPQYLRTPGIDLSSKDASDTLLPNEEYFDENFDENDKVRRASNISARADVASTILSDDEKAKTEESERVGRVLARESEQSSWSPCILTLDGGGIRGYSTLLILKQLMHQIWLFEKHLPFEEGDNREYMAIQLTSEDDLLPCHYFDFIYGSSSGGLIAILLGRLRMTINEALKFWHAFGDATFGVKKRLFPVTTRPDHQPFEKLVRELVKSRCGDHADCEGDDLYPHSPHEFGVDEYEAPSRRTTFDVDRPRICQSCCLTSKHEPSVTETYLLRTYRVYYDETTPKWVTPYNEGADVMKIWQAVRATLGAPFFPDGLSVEIDDVEKLFGDGVTSENNPAGAALSEFHALYEIAGIKYPAVMLSVGTGRPDRLQDGSHGYGSRTFGLPLVGRKLEQRAALQSLLIKHTEGEKQHYRMLEYTRGEQNWYKRINVDQGLGDVAMDDWEQGTWHGRIVAGGATLTKIERATQRYLDREFNASFDFTAPSQDNLRQAAEKLVRQRRAREQQGGVRWDIFVGKHLPKPRIELSTEASSNAGKRSAQKTAHSSRNWAPFATSASHNINLVQPQ